MAKIGLLITKLNGGGAERTVANLSKIFYDHGHDVNIILFDAKNISYPYQGNIIDLNLGTNSNVFEAVFKNINRAFKIIQIKKKYELDIMISFLDTPNFLNTITKTKKCKRIVSIRNNLSSEKQNFIRKKLIRYTSNCSDLTVSISESVRKDLINNFKVYGKIQTIYNPIDINTLLQKEESYYFPNDFDEYFNIVTMGRLTLQKGQWHLIKAMRSVIDNNPSTRLYILGEGELENELKKLVKKLHLEKYVIFLGYIKNAHKFMERCNLFVLPSLYEGLGNVLLEAMALSIPVISTACKSGPGEIIDPDSGINEKCNDLKVCKYGILIPPYPIEDNIHDDCKNEEKYLIEAINLLITDRNLFEDLKKHSLERSSYFSADTIYEEWKKIFEYNGIKN